jgi:peptide/nickel transport system ATP-binding protein
LTVEPLLDITNFSVAYPTDRGRVVAVRDVTLQVQEGEVLGLVGESGSGKSTLANAIMTLLPTSAEVTGRLAFAGQDLFALDRAARRRLRGNGVASVFQDPFTALNPVVRIGRQLIEFQRQMPRRSASQARRLAVDMLGRMGISDPAGRMKQYSFELSGGIRQRVMIAAALLTEPRLLIADEPTTALDATTELQVIELLRASRHLIRGSIVFVTHDMGLVAELCDRVAVLYAGEVVEVGATEAIIRNPRHPYTRALLACDPRRMSAPSRRFPTIPGKAPDPVGVVHGCAFASRCAEMLTGCLTERPSRWPAAGDEYARCLRLTS